MGIPLTKILMTEGTKKVVEQVGNKEDGVWRAFYRNAEKDPNLKLITLTNDPSGDFVYEAALERMQTFEVCGEKVVRYTTQPITPFPGTFEF